jgi:hypothetical protein
MRKNIKINGKEITLKIREPFAPLQKVKPSKKVYNRKKNKNNVEPQNE